MLDTLMKIGEQVVLSKICKAFDDKDGESEAWVEAAFIAEKDGYQLAYTSTDIVEPAYLEFYPELRCRWELGVEEGKLLRGAATCFKCNDPHNHVCTAHDH